MDKKNVKEMSGETTPDHVEDATQHNAGPDTCAPTCEPEPTSGQSAGESTGAPDDATADASEQRAAPANEADRSGAQPPAADDSQGSTLEARLAEAEQRGYLRGRNESIAQLMRQPGMFERMPDARAIDTDVSDSEIMVLTRERVSIWDK